MAFRDSRQYARMAVDLPINSKLADAQPQAKWLSVVAILWSTQNLTDGEVSPPIMTATAGVPAKFADDLVKRGVWHKRGHACPDCAQPKAAQHVVIHHYLMHQDSAEVVRRNKDDKAKSGRIGNHVKWNHAGDFDTCERCNP